jgi:ribosomal protein L11 methylase PrmA
MNITFTYDSWNDYLYWQQTDKQVLKKINQLLKDIKRVTKTGGTVIFSGIISSKKEDVISEMKKTGFTIEKIVEKDEWVSIVGRS